MEMNIIMAVCMYPFIFIMYLLLKFESKKGKGCYFGVTMTDAQAEEAGIEQIMKSYNKHMLILFLIMLLVPVTFFFLPWFSIEMTGWMLWMTVGIFAFFVPFARANGRLKEIKWEKGWSADAVQEIYVEMQGAGAVRCVKWTQFIIPVVISVGVFVWALGYFYGERMGAMSFGVGSVAFVTVLFWLLAEWMDRQKTQVICTDSAVNTNFARAKKQLWKNLWVASAWINTAYTAAMLTLYSDNRKTESIFWWATIAYVLLLAAIVYVFWRKRQKLEAAYFDKKDEAFKEDDDNWLWGLVYYNPKDKHAMVEKRVGVGTTMNMASPGGIIMGIIGGLAILSIPFLCAWMIRLEFTPIQLSVTDGRLVAVQMREEYRIPVDMVENVTLLEELPKLSRVSGTGMDNLLKGDFRVPEEGHCRVFLNPQNKLFIRFEAAGTTYYMSGYDDEETREIYEMLK